VPGATRYATFFFSSQAQEQCLHCKGGTAARRHGGTAARRHGGTAARHGIAANVPPTPTSVTFKRRGTRSQPLAAPPRGGGGLLHGPHWDWQNSRVAKTMPRPHLPWAIALQLDSAKQPFLNKGQPLGHGPLVFGPRLVGGPGPTPILRAARVRAGAPGATTPLFR